MVKKARTNGKSQTVVMDFDDLADTNDRLEVLMRLRERDPGFRVTLFAIPTRLSADTLARYDTHRSWIQLGIHGWRHSRHECLAWTADETQEKVAAARSIYPHFAPIFKAPNWETCDDVYEGLRASGVAVADHMRNIELIPAGMPHYIYNVRLRGDAYRRMHGHIQNWFRDGLEEEYEFWSSPPVGSTYLFVTDALTSRPASPQLA